jgi:hypothetical protein
MYRGTIVERVPNDHVDIKTASGDIKRFPMADVAYAGAAEANAPPPPPPQSPRPLVTVNGVDVPVHFQGDSPGIAFHLHSGDATGVGPRGGFSATAFTKICEAPCDATLPSGRYRFAVSSNGSDPIEVDQALGVMAPTIVRGRYISHSGVRIAGGILAGVGLAGASVLAFVAATSDKPNVGEYAGLVASGVAIIAGFIMWYQGDRVEIRLAPLAISATPTANVPADAARPLSERSPIAPSAIGPQGLALELRF